MNSIDWQCTAIIFAHYTLIPRTDDTMKISEERMNAVNNKSRGGILEGFLDVSAQLLFNN